MTIRLIFQKNLAKRMLSMGAAGFLGAVLAAAGQTQGDEGVGPFRSQTLQLRAGWNAVYLEIEPLKGNPSELFAGTPIEIAAAYLRPATAMEFIDSPSQVLPDRKGWSVWYAPERDDALLSNLYAIQAHQAFLLYTKEAFTWSMQGTPLFGSTRWHPNAFSLVGFPIDAGIQPTMAQFFAGAKAHTPLKIYQLTSAGNWTLVSDPSQVMMKPGTSYWVHSQGASEFAGPLQVTFGNSGSGGLVFGENSGQRQLQIRNVSPHPQNLTLTLQGGSNGVLPLAYVVRVLDGPNEPIEAVSVAFPQALELGPLEPGQAFMLDLEVAQEAVSAAVVSSTLAISSSAGVRIEVPVVSVRSDLITTP